MCVCVCVCACACRSYPERWWRRVYVEEFYPTVYLGDPFLENMLYQHGLKVWTTEGFWEDMPLYKDALNWRTTLSKNT